MSSLRSRLRRASARARRALERVASALVGFGLIVLAAWIALCAPPPPSEPEDLCVVFKEKRRWYEAARDSRQIWGLPESVLLAILFQESSLRSDAQPARRIWLGFLPGFRPSSAYGFGQILDGTWQDYLTSLEPDDRPGARRDRFRDVADFVGWYSKRVERSTGVPPTAARELYLAYHEGPAGYARGTHRKKAWLLAAADRVAARARRYEVQHAGCRADLEDPPWFPFS